MTGPENYREAERMIRVGRDRLTEGDSVASALCFAAAQVHATLAAAAATVGALDPEDYGPWREVLR